MKGLSHYYVLYHDSLPALFSNNGVKTEAVVVLCRSKDIRSACNTRLRLGSKQAIISSQGALHMNNNIHCYYVVPFIAYQKLIEPLQYLVMSGSKADALFAAA